MNETMNSLGERARFPIEATEAAMLANKRDGTLACHTDPAQ